VAIIQDGLNLIEVGWFREEAEDNQAHPYKTRVENGVSTTWKSVQIDLSTNAFHEFKVHDANADNLWSFAYDGNPLGNEFSSVDLGTPVTESERRCTNDSLFAHLRYLKVLKITGGTWEQYLSLFQYMDSAPDYRFCRISTTEYKVRQTC
jgi:hypothetical protein